MTSNAEIQGGEVFNILLKNLKIPVKKWATKRLAEFRNLARDPAKTQTTEPDLSLRKCLECINKHMNAEKQVVITRMNMDPSRIHAS